MPNRTTIDNMAEELDDQWKGIRDAVANNRRLTGQPPQPMHETHDWNELALEAVKLTISAVNIVLTNAEDIHGAAHKLQEAAKLMGHAAEKRAPEKASLVEGEG